MLSVGKALLCVCVSMLAKLKVGELELLIVSVEKSNSWVVVVVVWHLPFASPSIDLLLSLNFF